MTDKLSVTVSRRPFRFRLGRHWVFPCKSGPADTELAGPFVSAFAGYSGLKLIRHSLPLLRDLEERVPVLKHIAVVGCLLRLSCEFPKAC